MSFQPFSPILAALLAKCAALRSANPSRAYFGARTAAQKQSRKANQHRGEIFQSEVEISIARAQAKSRRRGGQPGNANAVRTPAPKPAELEQVESSPNPRFCAWKPCGAFLPAHTWLSRLYCPGAACAQKARRAADRRRDRSERKRAKEERTGAIRGGDRTCGRCGVRLVALNGARKYCRGWKCRRGTQDAGAK